MRRKEGGARSARDTAGVEIPAVHEAAAVESRSLYFLFSRAVGEKVEEGGGLSLSRETLPFFYLPLFRNPADGAKPAVDSRAGLSSAVRENGRARVSAFYLLWRLLQNSEAILADFVECTTI